MQIAGSVLQTICFLFHQNTPVRMFVTKGNRRLALELAFAKVTY